MTDRYLVVGNPIKQSKSPQIHRYFAHSLNQDISYQSRLVEVGRFADDIGQFFADGGCGLNVTVPFKQQACSFAEQLSDRARLAGAVNTLYRDSQGRICGDNTDGVGLVRDLQVNHGALLRDKRVLILGAGGAVRGVLAPLLATLPRQLVIANRTAERAAELARDFAALGPVSGGGYQQLQGPFDLVINGTSASLQGQLPPLADGLLAADAWCYDMMYAAQPTPFMNWANGQGAARVMDGLGMLVEQAAESFYIWRGVRPQTAALISSLRTELQS